MAAAVQNQIRKVEEKIKPYLYEGPLTSYWGLVEGKTKVKREQIAFGILGLLALYLLFGWGNDFLCNFLGFIYPAYASVLAVESKGSHDDTEWLMYWVIYALFGFIEYIGYSFFQTLPFYWLGKCIFLVWLMVPGDKGGSKFLYTRFVRPFALKHRSTVDQHLRDAKAYASKCAPNSCNTISRPPGQMYQLLRAPCAFYPGRPPCSMFPTWPLLSKIFEQLKERKQKSDETVTSYYDAIIKLCHNTTNRQRTLSKNTQVGHISYQAELINHLILPVSSEDANYQPTHFKSFIYKRSNTRKSGFCDSLLREKRKVRFTDFTCETERREDQQHYCYKCYPSKASLENGTINILDEEPLNYNDREEAHVRDELSNEIKNMPDDDNQQDTRNNQHQEYINHKPLTRNQRQNRKHQAKNIDMKSFGKFIID
ncbi:unnamed protein product [Rotaria socialis]|uniref:Receptor expression-enhancing protein n=1 Tax=Rotaria socialis TaxID=392032 RepID=A0A817ZBJ2_9BILA|nr:unnamed protein product [Rotaria socialis]